MTDFATPESLNRRWVVGLLAVTLLGLGTRLVGLETHSVWYDEAITQQIIRSPLAEHFAGSARDNGNPPGYTIVARSWQQLVGPGDTRLRGLSVLCGVLTVPFVGLLGRRILTPTVGLVAALLYAVSPLAVEFANESRTYALLQLLAVVNAWLFVRWLAEGGVGNWSGYAATMFLCWYSHYYAAFLTAAHVLVLLTLPWNTRRVSLWIGAIVVAGLVWAAWLPTFFAQLGTAGNLTRSAETWKIQFLATPVSYAFGRTLAWRDSSLWLLAVAGLGTVAGFLVPAVIGAVRVARRRPTAALLLGWLLVPIVIPFLLAVAYKPIYSHRYAAVGLPAFVLLVALGYMAMRPGLRWVFGLSAGFLTIASLIGYATTPLKDDWRSATPVIQARLRPGNLVVFDTAIEVASYQHYAGSSEPMKALGLDSPTVDLPFPGIRYHRGERIDPVARDCTEDMFASDRVCLVLCVPKREPTAYEEMFRRRGYALTDTESFHRIRILWFVRRPGQPGESTPRPQSTP